MMRAQLSRVASSVQDVGANGASPVAMPRYFYPKIDYRAHPAFRDINVPLRSDDHEIDLLIAEIDRELISQQKSHRSTEAELEWAFVTQLLPKIEALSDYISGTISDERVSSWLRRAFTATIEELQDYLRIRNRRHVAKATARLSDGGRIVAQDLEHDGVRVCRLDSPTHQQLLKLCAPYMTDMREQARSKPKQRIVRNFELYGEIGSLLAKFFRRQGILDGLSGYVGSNVNFAGFSLEYSYAGQVWWSGVYSDLGLSDAKTTYMHYDQGCRDPKAIIALTDVGEENGPTGFVRGSHKKERSAFLHFMITALDRCFQRDGLDDQKSANYRPRFSDIRYRRELLMLPEAFQGSSHFGDDIQDGSPLSDELLKNEIRMTSDVGNCIIFDGNYGIHRGALVKSGERFVFQVIFDIDDPLPLLTYLKRRLRGFALRVLRGRQ